MAGIRPKRRRRTTDPKPPKLEVVVEKTTRWYIMSKTDEGRLVEPMTRERYDYNDSRAFDYDGYETLEKAEEAIVEFSSRRERTMHECYVSSGLWNGKTSGETNEFLIIPSCKVHVYRKEVVESVQVQ